MQRKFFFREARQRVSVQSERHLRVETAAILKEQGGEGDEESVRVFPAEAPSCVRFPPEVSR